MDPDETTDLDLHEEHPEGDEIVHLVSGAVDLVLDLADGPFRVPLRAVRTVVVPAACGTRRSFVGRVRRST